MASTCRTELRTVAVRMLFTLAASVACSSVWAQATVPSSDDYVTKCSGCHQNPVRTRDQGSVSTMFASDFGKILSSARLNADYTDLRNASLDNSSMPASRLTKAYITDAELSKVHDYLIAVRDALVTPSLPGFPVTNVGSTSAAQDVSIANLRGAAITYSFSRGGVNAGDFLVSQLPGGCATSASVGSVAAAASAASPSTCTLRVSFTPLASGDPGSRNASLAVAFDRNVNCDPMSGNFCDPIPPSRSISISGYANVAPAANAGIAQNVVVGAAVTLDGSASSDANADLLTYAWSLTSMPAGSAATLSSTVSVSPTFTADVAGTYVATLVVNDGRINSPNSTNSTVAVTASVPNTAPVANAGPPQSVVAGTTVMLDGSASSDANGDALTYAWVLTSKPAGSAATLSSSTVIKPTFSADLAGTYVATLKVNDGTVNSPAMTVTITAAVANVAPIGNAGPAQSVVVGATVPLDGSSSSDANGDVLTYAWSLTSKPAGSAAILNSTAAVKPTFIADVAGTYVATLVVNDGKVNSSPSLVTITAAVGNAAPVANAGPAQSLVAGATVTLDGSASSDANGDALTYTWVLTSKPAGSATGLNSTTAIKPTFIADVAGSYVVSLVVNDGKVNSSPSAVTVTVANALPVFSISPSMLGFATVVGTSVTMSAIISNTGGTSFALTAVSFSGPASADYSLDTSNGCTAGLSLAASSSCTLVIRFNPPTAGTRDAVLSITHGAAGSPQSVSLRGTATPAPQGRIELSALSLAFADTQLGSSSLKSITVRNTGTLALTFSAFTFGGAVPADFERTGTCGAAVPLPINQQCTLTLTFRPAALGVRSASLSIQSDASNGAAAIALTGTSVPVPAPLVTLSAATLDFGAQTVGGLYPTRSIRLTNAGTADLVTTAIAVEGAGFANASTAACLATLAPGAGCDVDISFSPTVADTDATGTLRVTSNAAGSPHTATLRGRGTATIVPVLVWSPAATRLDFGQVSAGTVSATQSVILLNQGPGGVNLTVLNAVGTDAAAFSVTAGTCEIGKPLFAGSTCRIDVRFAPASAGDKNASVQIASTGSFPPTLTLHGNGLGGPSPSLAVSATALTFDAIRIGTQSVPTEVTLSSNGSGVVRVTGMVVSGPFAMQNKTCPSAPFTLQAGAECTVTVTFVPQAEGDAPGLLSVSTDASPALREVALSGKGEAKADVSSGGCSIGTGDSLADPTLWVLSLLAVAALLYRQRARRRSRVPVHPSLHQAQPRADQPRRRQP